MPHPHHDIDVWSVEGRFAHLIFSPKGAVEGFLLETDGIPTQFVVDPREAGLGATLAGLRAGQRLMVEGIEAEASPKGEAVHTVYHLERVAQIDGKALADPARPARVAGRVVRLNYAKHGEPNGVVLDSGDFVHLRPEGFRRAALKVGDRVEAEGAAQPLATGSGRVLEAWTLDGRPVEHEPA